MNVDPCPGERARFAALGSKLTAITGGVPGYKLDQVHGLIDTLEERRDKWLNTPDGREFNALRERLSSVACQRSKDAASFLPSGTWKELREVEVQPELNWPLIGWIDVSWAADTVPPQ
jgi:hypothetical protein